MAIIELTRRRVLATAAAASAALSAPFVRGAYAAGKLSVGFWDHWVPGANDTHAKLCREWADKEITPYGLNQRYHQATEISDWILKGSDKWNEKLRIYANYVGSPSSGSGGMGFGASLRVIRPCPTVQRLVVIQYMSSPIGKRRTTVIMISGSSRKMFRCILSIWAPMKNVDATCEPM